MANVDKDIACNIMGGACDKTAGPCNGIAYYDMRWAEILADEAIKGARSNIDGARGNNDGARNNGGARNVSGARNSGYGLSLIHI